MILANAKDLLQDKNKISIWTSSSISRCRTIRYRKRRQDETELMKTSIFGEPMENELLEAVTFRVSEK